MSKKIILPHAGIVLLIGPSNSGKTTMLNHLQQTGVLLPSEIVSSDQFRVLVGDVEYIELSNHSKDEQEVLNGEYQGISQKAFEVMTELIAGRCILGKLTIVDATHLWPEDRKKYINLAAKNHVPVQAIALDIPETTLLERDRQRTIPRGRNRIKQQVRAFRNNLHSLKTEGFQGVTILNELESQEVTFERSENPLFKEVGMGLDFIGDIHGCYSEFIQLLEALGYQADKEGLYTHPQGRRLVSVGDVLSRGPDSLACLEFFCLHVERGLAYMVDSNHGWKIARWLLGRNVELGHGDEQILKEFEDYESKQGREAADQLKDKVKNLLLSAPSHLIFRQNEIGVIVAVHAGIRDRYIGKQSKRISDFCRYGDTDGFGENGKPIRKDWFNNHLSGEIIIWGHDPRPQPLEINNTINIDQGVVFGGRLTAYRYPEKTFAAVPALSDYAQDPDSFLNLARKERFNPPNIQNYLKGYSVTTELHGEVKVKGEYVKAVIEDISHYTIPLEELVYIPPTMSPAPDPSSLAEYLEHPREAFRYYRNKGINTMIAEKKHMGSRGILLLFKDREAGANYVGTPLLGIVYTRTGRAFFERELADKVIEQLHGDLTQGEYFTRHKTDFVLLDTEILPWNLKAKELISSQYAHVSEVALQDRQKLVEKLALAKINGWNVEAWLAEFKMKEKNAVVFRDVFQNYCWDTQGVQGIKIAPFHILAHQGKTYFEQPHLWHMEQCNALSELSSLLVKTEFKIINDEMSEQEAIRWWEEMTENGHEGFVVKPETFIARNEKGWLMQPAIKVRGRKYLHIIYGMDYLQPENLMRLKQRDVRRKQRHALMEFALGVEGIKRFVSEESLARIHECVLATLSLETEPVDPRL